MSKLLNDFKLDKWWKIVLWLGILSIVSSFVYTPEFIKSKNLFGLGLGLILIGMSYLIAEKSYSWIKPSNVYTGGLALITQKIIKHNVLTRLIFFIGVGLMLFFIFLIVKNLI